jgi:hypothetical protein
MTRDFESAVFASVYGTEPAYEATAPDIQARRHVQAPSILGDMQINSAKGKAGRASSADMPARIDGGNPEYTANMPSTSRSAPDLKS